MIKRRVAEKLLELTHSFPVITIEGPRQSGKTTLARMTFPDYAYADLEEYATRTLAERDPRGFLLRFPAPSVIDEIQRVPQLLNEIQAAVDANGANGQYVLTGSHQPRLKEGIAQSLAGRTALLTLYPLSIAELADAGIRMERDSYIFKGFPPAIYDRVQNPVDAYEGYYRTYVEHDVRQLVNITHQGRFELFLRLLAERVGQVVNMDGLSGEVGVSATTFKEWLSVLEESFVIYRLHPYYNNFGKRFIKSPKVYFTDVGLAAHLLQIESPQQVTRDPLAGGLFENLVVMEALKAQLNHGQPPRLYYMRDKAGVEADLVVETHRRLRLFEIKSACTPDASMASNLQRMGRLSDTMETGSVIYSGEDWKMGDIAFTHFSETERLMVNQ